MSTDFGHMEAFLNAQTGWVSGFPIYPINPVSECSRNSRKPEADRRDKREQDQRDDHAQVERKSCLDNLLHRTLGYGGTDEKNGSDRRSQKSDTAVEHHHDTELDRMDSYGLGNRQQDGGSDQDDRSHIHDAAENQQDQIQKQGDDDRVGGDTGDQVCRLGGNMKKCQTVAESSRHRDQDQNDGQGFDTVIETLADDHQNLIGPVVQRPDLFKLLYHGTYEIKGKRDGSFVLF